MIMPQLPAPMRHALMGLVAVAVAPAVSLAATPTDATPGARQQPGVVSNIKVLSDNVEDVSSIEAWKQSVIKDGMSDTEKALAVWETVVKFRQQENPPHEFLGHGSHVHDPIKTFNVYGYGQCSCASSNIQALARAVGLESRGRIVSHHSVPEVKWDGKWRMLDASLICYFKHPDGSIAGVDDLFADVAAWDEKSTDFDLNPPKEELEKLTGEERAKYLKAFDAELDKKLRAHSKSEAFRQDGPELFKNSEFLGVRGWFPAKTHGWYSIVTCFDGRAKGIMEYGYSQGYRVNVQLRPGERLTRNWSNKGLHVNKPERGDKPLTVVSAVPGKGDLVYSPEYGDLAPGRVGNGTHEYDVPLADGRYRGGALVTENLADADGDGPTVGLADSSKPGTLVLRMPTSYVYLSGSLDLDAVVGNGGNIAVELSDNNGLDWKPVATITSPGRQTIDLTPHVYRRYDYRLKLTLNGAGTGLDALKLSHDIQHSQRALPALDEGSNTIAFSSAAQEGTITIEGRTRTTEKSADKSLAYTDFKPEVQNIRDGDGVFLAARQGSITFPIATPGDMTRIRMGSFYRARSEGDGWEYQVSFEGGRTFKTIGKATSGGPSGADNSVYVTFEDVPPGTREALVRYAGTQQSATGIFDFRIDADYAEPNGGFAPVKVTYVWEENGEEKRDERIVSKPQETYQINCAAKPVMKSLILELAQ